MTDLANLSFADILKLRRGDPAATSSKPPTPPELEPAEPAAAAPVATPLAHAPIVMADGRRLSSIPLSALRIDFDQPRRYLPLDLRQAFAVGKLTAEAVARELLARAGRDDAEAAGYVESIRRLADTIDDVGLRQPITVRRLRREPPAFEIVDGERRFWARVFDCARRGRALDQEWVTVIEEAEPADPDAESRAQWIVNDQREGTPAVVFADFVAATYQSLYDRVLNQRRATCEMFDLDYDETADARTLAIAVTGLALRRRTGRTVAARSIYRLLYIHDSLSATSKALAKAHAFSLRVLERLAQVKDIPEQERLAHKLARPDAAPAAPDSPAAAKPGRRNAFDAQSAVLAGVADALAKPDRFMRAFAAADSERQQTYLASVEATAEALGRHLAAVRRAMNRV